MALPDAIKVFRSTDANAPSIVGAAGSLTAFLDAILVNGYNARSVASITVAAGIATLTVGSGGAHGFVPGQIIVISGANEAAFNNEFVMTSAPTGSTLTFTVAGAPASATGTITVKQASLNFEKLAFAGTPTNWGNYRSTDVRSIKHVLNVDNTSAYWARVSMYETMTGYATGVNGDQSLANPATSNQAKFGTWQQGLAADTTAKPWIAFGNSRTFYILCKWGAAATMPGADWWGFGEFKSYRQADFYNGFLMASFSNNLASYPNQQVSADLSGTNGSTIQGHIALLRTGLCLAPISGSGWKSGLQVSSAGSTWRSGGVGMAFPSIFGSQILVGQITLHELSGPYMRGVLPGFLNIYNTVSLEEVVLSCADYPGRTLQAVKVAVGSSTFTNFMVDLTGPWTMP